MQDDSRGLGQGVKDSVLTLEAFKLLIERRLSTTKVSCFFSILVHDK